MACRGPLRAAVCRATSPLLRWRSTAAPFLVNSFSSTTVVLTSVSCVNWSVGSSVGRSVGTESGPSTLLFFQMAGVPFH